MAAASRAGDSGRASSPDLHKSVDCPICFQVFENPKSLNCGHSLCEKCCVELKNRSERGRSIQCPTCRSRTNVLANGLPTNYSLQDIVSMMVSKEGAARFTCGNCAKKFDKSEVWLCHACSSAVLCAVCSLKHHKGHHLQEMGDLISHRQKEINKWKEKIAAKLADLEKEDKEVSTGSVGVRAKIHQLTNLLASGANYIQKVRQEVKKEYVELKKEHDAFGDDEEALDTTAASVVCDVADEITSQEEKIELFVKKQKEASKNQKAFLNTLNDFETTVRNILGEEAEAGGTNKRKRIKAQKSQIPILRNAEEPGTSGTNRRPNSSNLIDLDSDSDPGRPAREQLRSRMRDLANERPLRVSVSPPEPGTSRQERRAFWTIGGRSRAMSQSPDPEPPMREGPLRYRRDRSSSPDSEFGQQHARTPYSFSPSGGGRRSVSPEEGESPNLRLEVVSPMQLGPASPMRSPSTVTPPPRLRSQSPVTSSDASPRSVGGRRARISIAPTHRPRFRWSSESSDDGATPVRRSRYNEGADRHEFSDY